MPPFCYACLTEEREVKLVDNHVKPTLLEWFNNSNLKVNVDNFLLCWECYAMVVKLNKFKRQVFKAQHIRLKVNKKKSARLVKLSQMCVYSKENYDCTYVYKECDAEITKTTKETLKRKNETSHSKTKNKQKKQEPDPAPQETFTKIVNVYNYYSLIKNETTNVSEPNKKEWLKEFIDLTKDPKLSLMPVVLIDKEVKQELIDAYETENQSTTLNTDVDRAVQDTRPSVIVRLKPIEDGEVNREESSLKFIIVKLTEDQMLKTRELDRSERLYMKHFFKCESCVVAFAEETELDKHNKEKHSQLIGEFDCPICATRFNKESLLNRHKGTHYLSYKCRQCDFKHHRRYVIEMHVVKEHDQTPSPVCGSCDTVFDTQQRLNAHFEKDHKDKLKCNQCAQNFDTVDRLKDHAASHKEKDEVIEVFPCDVCKGSFEGKAAYRAHMQCLHKDLAEHAYCQQCDLQFNNLKKFKLHLKRHSPFDQLILDRANGSSEETVGVDLKRAHRMLSHSCGLCKKGFSDEMRLKVHIQQKHPEVVTEPAKDESIYLCQQTEQPEVVITAPPKDKKCPICSEGFVSRNELLTHIRIHKAEKQFKCHICGKRYASKTTLKKHVRAHKMEEDSF